MNVSGLCRVTRMPWRLDVNAVGKAEATAKSSCWSRLMRAVTVTVVENASVMARAFVFRRWRWRFVKESVVFEVRSACLSPAGVPQGVHKEQYTAQKYALQRHFCAEHRSAPYSCDAGRISCDTGPQVAQEQSPPWGQLASGDCPCRHYFAHRSLGPAGLAASRGALLGRYLVTWVSNVAVTPALAGLIRREPGSPDFCGSGAGT